VPRLYRAVRSGARYQRTLDLLANVKKFAPGMVSKTGVMVGIGEETDELLEVFRDLAKAKGGHPHHRTVPASFQRPSADDAILLAGRVPLPQKQEALTMGFRQRRIRTRGALQLSRARAGCIDRVAITQG